jgi:hypothetical protein
MDLFFVPGEKFGSFTHTHLFYPVIFEVWSLPKIIQVFRLVEIMRIP